MAPAAVPRQSRQPHDSLALLRRYVGRQRRWQAEAERMEMLEEESKDNHALNADGEGLKQGALPRRQRCLCTYHVLRVLRVCCARLVRFVCCAGTNKDATAMEDTNRAVVVMNAQGIIQVRRCCRTAPLAATRAALRPAASPQTKLTPPARGWSYKRFLGREQGHAPDFRLPQVGAQDEERQHLDALTSGRAPHGLRARLHRLGALHRHGPHHHAPRAPQGVQAHATRSREAAPHDILHSTGSHSREMPREEDASRTACTARRILSSHGRHRALAHVSLQDRSVFTVTLNVAKVRCWTLRARESGGACAGPWAPSCT